jgi:hypothetical protein
MTEREMLVAAEMLEDMTFAGYMHMVEYEFIQKGFSKPINIEYYRSCYDNGWFPEEAAKSDFTGGTVNDHQG